MKLYQSDLLLNDSFSRGGARHILRPCFCGLEFPHKTLLKIMGKQDFANHLVKREQMYDEFRSREFSCEGFPIENLNALIQEARGDPIDAKCIRLNRFKYKIQIDEKLKYK